MISLSTADVQALIYWQNTGKIIDLPSGADLNLEGLVNTITVMAPDRKTTVDGDVAVQILDPAKISAEAFNLLMDTDKFTIYFPQNKGFNRLDFWTDRIDGGVSAEEERRIIKFCGLSVLNHIFGISDDSKAERLFIDNYSRAVRTIDVNSGYAQDYFRYLSNYANGGRREIGGDHLWHLTRTASAPRYLLNALHPNDRAWVETNCSVEPEAE